MRTKNIKTNKACSIKCFARHNKYGFTLVELFVVIVILAIAAVLAIPMLGSSETAQLRSAANMIAADLEYAKSMAISSQKTYTVIFDENAESYRIENDSGVIEHPVKRGFDFVINFKTDSSTNKVNLVQADFISSSQVSFNYLGSPDNGGSIVLSAGSSTVTVSIESVTGYISISQ